MNESYIARTSGLKTKDYVGYAMIDAAGCLVFSLVTTLLQKFYTDIFHLSPLFITLLTPLSTLSQQTHLSTLRLTLQHFERRTLE